MTTATVTEIKYTETGIYAEATCGKTSACVGITRSEHLDYVTVICMNASHRAWKRGGRRFADVKEAIGSYKSEEMKAIIAAVDARNN